MLIYVSTADGLRWRAGINTAENIVTGVPAGARVTGLTVGGASEPCDFVSDGADILIQLPAIRRLLSGERKVA